MLGTLANLANGGILCDCQTTLAQCQLFKTVLAAARLNQNIRLCDDEMKDWAAVHKSMLTRSSSGHISKASNFCSG